jgi:hypothetical protein
MHHLFQPPKPIHIAVIWITVTSTTVSMKYAATILRVEVLKIKPVDFSEKLITPFQYARSCNAVWISTVVKNLYSLENISFKAKI